MNRTSVISLSLLAGAGLAACSVVIPSNLSGQQQGGTANREAPAAGKAIGFPAFVPGQGANVLPIKVGAAELVALHPQTSVRADIRWPSRKTMLIPDNTAKIALVALPVDADPNNSAAYLAQAEVVRLPGEATASIALGAWPAEPLPSGPVKFLSAAYDGSGAMLAYGIATADLVPGRLTPVDMALQANPGNGPTPMPSPMPSDLPPPQFNVYLGQSFNPATGSLTVLYMDPDPTQPGLFVGETQGVMVMRTDPNVVMGDELSIESTDPNVIAIDPATGSMSSVRTLIRAVSPGSASVIIRTRLSHGELVYNYRVDPTGGASVVVE